MTISGNSAMIYSNKIKQLQSLSLTINKQQNCLLDAQAKLSKKMQNFDDIASQQQAINQQKILEAGDNKQLEYEELEKYKKYLLLQYRSKLKALLCSNKVFDFTPISPPLISIILVLYNKAELTLECLDSLSNDSELKRCEIIIVDNASSDETEELLQRLKGVKIIRNPLNLHFLLASNQGSVQAEGKYILFLNNDTQVLPGTIAASVKTIESSEDIGAVGGKIILLDGRLQEAGSIIWKDGSCLGYGRGDDPFAPMYMFKRDVDYCSGAFLLTHRELFLQMGCFDLDYQPAYYEETDYCLKLREIGKRVVYDPDVVLLHFEFASSSSSEQAIELQAINREIFLRKHDLQLRSHLVSEPENILWARQTNDRNNYRVLFIEDRVPHSQLGSGYPRAQDILRALLENNYFVTLYPLQAREEDWLSVYETIPKSVEVMTYYGVTRLKEFLKQRKNYYQVILISRPHNMQILKPILAEHPAWFTQTEIVYDAEALYSSRDIMQRNIKGQNILGWHLEDELELLKGGDCIISVSEGEKKKLMQYGFENIAVLGHCLSIELTENSFEERENILFIGAIHEENSPNADSIIWFVEEIFPEIKNRLETDPKLLIVGLNKSDKVADLAKRYQSVELVGQVEDLSMYYNQARIFIAPTRFAAGIPMKVHHAASRGLPIVATSLIASQVGWQDGEEILVADEPSIFAEQCVRLYTNAHLWEKLRSKALERIVRECSREAFVDKLRQIFSPGVH